MLSKSMRVVDEETRNQVCAHGAVVVACPTHYSSNIRIYLVRKYTKCFAANAPYYVQDQRFHSPYVQKQIMIACNRRHFLSKMITSRCLPLLCKSSHQSDRWRGVPPLVLHHLHVPFVDFWLLSVFFSLWCLLLCGALFPTFNVWCDVTCRSRTRAWKRWKPTTTLRTR